MPLSRLNSIDQRHACTMTIVTAGVPVPNQITISGSSAMPGSGCAIAVKVSVILSTNGLRRAATPRSSASTMLMKNPSAMIASENTVCKNSVPENIPFQNAAATCSTGGSSSGEIPENAATASQTTSSSVKKNRRLTQRFS